MTGKGKFVRVISPVVVRDFGFSSGILYANCRNFINADLIAQGMAPFSPETAAFRAGKLMLTEIDLLAQRRADFGFETTLSGRSYLRLIARLKKQGYAVHFFFLWLSSVDLALSRIKGRVV